MNSGIKEEGTKLEEPGKANLITQISFLSKEKKVIEEENKKLLMTMGNLQMEVAELKKEVNQKELGKNSIKESTSQIEAKNREISSLQNCLTEKDSLIKSLKEKNSTLEKLEIKSDQLDKENNNLKKEIESMKASFNDSLQLNNSLTESQKKLNEENQMIKEECQRKINDYKEECQRKINDYQEECQRKINDYQEGFQRKIDSLENFKSGQNTVSAADFYDLIIDVNSLTKLTKGWEIQYSKEGEERFQKFKEEVSCVIGVIGNFNKGKSFLLQKLSDYDLPHGYSIQTRGLSVKYPLNMNKSITLLDTAGFELPLKYVEDSLIQNSSELEQYDQNIISQMSRDRQLTELFLQKFVIESSNILLAVVGILTYSDQKLLIRLRKFCKKKKMFIIHNLSQFVTRSQVEAYISDTLSKTFHLSLRQYVILDDQDDKIFSNFCPTYYVDSSENSDIAHLILANDFSDAGKYYNTSSFHFLKNQIKSFFTKVGKFPVDEMLKKHLYDTSRELMEEETKIDLDQISIDNNLFRLKSDKEILLKKCFVDELGFSKFYGSNFTPNYTYLLTENGFLVIIEICDFKLKIDPVMVSGEYYFFKITGEKQICPDYSNTNAKGVFFNSREAGKFSVTFTIPVQYFLLKNVLPEKHERKEGYIILYYGIHPQGTEESLII